ncbi:MAG TPA: ATP-binding protein [Dehalococcoidia bacterium]|nr:ATP-binding protein [Dehalococcoidia bacterium]
MRSKRVSDRGELQVYNPAMLELVGYDAASIEIDRMRLGRRLAFADFLSPAELDRLLAMGTARLGGESPDAVQVRIRHREGRWIDVEASSSLYPDGESVGVLVEVRVVTEELRLQQALLQTQKLEAVGTFVGGVAHDFNNLLTTIGGSIELARDTDDARQWLERATVSTERAARLVQELLQFSRTDSAVREPIDLSELVDRSIERVSEAIDARIEVTRADAGGLLLVRGDPEQLQQVLVNVIVNAAEALDGRLTGGDASAERARISVRLSTTSEGLHEVVVTDDGVGIAPEIQHRSFDPFFTSKVVGHATGLGLSTAYGIVAGTTAR